MAVAPIPLELVELIISFLHPGSLNPLNGEGNFLNKSSASTTAKCALVCRAWLPPSRRILFYRVHIGKYQAYGFAQLFTRPDRLTFLPFIREVAFQPGIAQHTWMQSVFKRKLAKHFPPSVETLVLEGFSSEKPTPEALHCPAFTGITRFELRGSWNLALSEAVKCIASFPVLEVLEVNLALELDQTRLPAPADQPAATLRSATFIGRGVQPVVAWVQASEVAVSALRFSVTDMVAGHQFITSIVQYTAQQGPLLSSLSLAFEGPNLEERGHALLLRDFLKHNTRLKTLTIKASLAQIVSIILSAINRHALPELEVLRIIVQEPITQNDLAAQPFWRTYYAAPREPHYRELDRLLEPHAVLRRLIVAHFPHYGPELRAPESELKASVMEAMPLCVARGVVEVDPEPEGDSSFWWL
ncbi:hypothetical protein GGX14DRAFT_429511 [Mycena pura]|uniref:F-box domain-containing protein n=1 Tax=Mycena pura TaxID=153505 RepID=A0AAD6VVP3_9AGAR|nr:hypothetical protein GGX14DRAFT_429511 [Mycena pura]